MRSELSASTARTRRGIGPGVYRARLSVAGAVLERRVVLID